MTSVGTKEFLANHIEATAPGERFVIAESRRGVVHVIAESDSALKAIRDAATEAVPCHVALFVKTPTQLAEQHVVMLEMVSDAKRESRNMAALVAVVCLVMTLMGAVL